MHGRRSEYNKKRSEDRTEHDVGGKNRRWKLTGKKERGNRGTRKRFVGGTTRKTAIRVEGGRGGEPRETLKEKSDKMKSDGRRKRKKYTRKRYNKTARRTRGKRRGGEPRKRFMKKEK